MKILVTGTAGFIGAAVALKLLSRGDTVIGLDNHNNYYDQALKEARLRRLTALPGYKHLRTDLSDRNAVKTLFELYRPARVINLAAQAGVRYSLENPSAYINSNIVGFANILESCRSFDVEHLVYASSSSVYGANAQLPYSVNQNVDHPLSLYAATKKSNELMAHSYSHLYQLPTTGLRFFTVYGPWGRPDMALFKFTQAILSNQPIKIFNYGQHRRDFTYIDDVVEVILRVLDRPATKNMLWDSKAPSPASSSAPYSIFNVGNSQSIQLIEYISALEQSLGRTAEKEWLPMQPGDIPDTQASVEELEKVFGYMPKTEIAVGIENFVRWYREYYAKT
jgi:UDP-glucuronate 4-epimerase